MADPLEYGANRIDLSDRFANTTTVAASPAAGAITTVATVTWSPAGNPAVVSGAYLRGYASFTAGTNGVSALLQIRRGTSAGTVVGTSGAVTVSAASLYSIGILGLDLVAFVPGQAWVLCLTIASGSATSTVSACQLDAIIV